MNQRVFYSFIFLLAIGMLVVSQRYFKGSGTAYVGIATGKSQQLSAGQPAVVDSVFVVPGQQVPRGALLVRLRSPELEVEVARIDSRLEVLQSELDEKSALQQSAIALLQAENQVKAEEFRSEIRKLETELSLNEKISGQKVTEGPMTEQIRSLRTQLENLNKSYSIRISDLSRKLEGDRLQWKNQLKLLQQEREILINRRGTLELRSPMAGVIDKVLVKRAEELEAYATLITMNPVEVKSVVGYLMGTKTAPPVGTAVQVRSAQGGDYIGGKIIGYGSMAELPEILQKSTAVKAFGREVFIEVEANALAMGERVLIK